MDKLLDIVANGLLHASWWQMILVVLAVTHVTIASVTIFLHRHQAHRTPRSARPTRSAQRTSQAQPQVDGKRPAPQPEVGAQGNSGIGQGDAAVRHRR